MACRGTGRVISNLGGSESTVACPWCEGSGLRPAEIDAQAHWPREGEGEGAGSGGAGAEARDAGTTADAPDARTTADAPDAEAS